MLHSICDALHAAEETSGVQNDTSEVAEEMDRRAGDWPSVDTIATRKEDAYRILQFAERGFIGLRRARPSTASENRETLNYSKKLRKLQKYK